jgi:hypothetical protein
MRLFLAIVVTMVLVAFPGAGCGKVQDEPQQQTTSETVQSTEETTDTAPDTVIKLRGTEDPDISVEVYIEEEVWPGTTILPDNHNQDRPRIIEVNMLGEIVWEYTIPEELRRYTNPGFDVEPLPNDNVLMVLPAKGVYEIDRTGKVVWSYITEKISHDADRLPNGNTLFVFGNEDTKNDPQVVEVNAQGKVVWEWYAGDCFNEPPYDSLEDQGWTHTNAVTRLSDGTTLISLRNFGFIAEVNSEGAVIRKIGEGLLSHQHDPEVLPDGNILIADHSEPQRAVEINGETEEIVWQYYLQKQLVRDVNRLPNGNTLVTGATRIVEVNAEGKVVWQLELNMRLGGLDAARLGFYKAERLQPESEYPEVMYSELPSGKSEEPKEEKIYPGFEWTVDPGIRYEDASVPFAYRLSDGRIRLYHGGRGGISSAISEDGLVFEEEATSLIQQGMLGDLDAIVSDPTVVALEDGRIRMYYKGANGSGGPGEAIHTVYSAISDDGLNFTAEGIRIDSQATPDRGWASVPDAVMLPDGRVRLYYVSDGLDVGHGIVCAISDDGLNFTREEPVLTGYVDPSVIMLPDERFMMLAVALRTGPKDSADFKPGIHCFISEDGIHFEKVGLALSGEDNIDPAIVAMGDGFYRVYYWNSQDSPNLIRSFSGRIK